MAAVHMHIVRPTYLHRARLPETSGRGRAAGRGGGARDTCLKQALSGHERLKSSSRRRRAEFVLLEWIDLEPERGETAASSQPRVRVSL